MSTDLTLPLDIPDVRVLKTTTNSAGDYVITVESTLDSARCHRCGQEVSKLHGYDVGIQLRHLPVRGRKVYIHIRPKRYQCPYCPGKPTTTQEVAWYDPESPYTRAYEEQVLLQLASSTVQDVVLGGSMSADALAGIVTRWTSTPVDSAKWERLQVLGLNEIALQEDHERRVVIVTTERADGQAAVLTVLKDCQKETIKQFLQTLPSHLRTGFLAPTEGGGG